MTTETGIEFSVGDVVQVADAGKRYGAFVIRIFKDGGFRGIPESNPLAYKAAGWYLAGRMDELSYHRLEMEKASKLYEGSLVVKVLDPNPFASKQFAAR